MYGKGILEAYLKKQKWRLSKASLGSIFYDLNAIFYLTGK